MTVDQNTKFTTILANLTYQEICDFRDEFPCILQINTNSTFFRSRSELRDATIGISKWDNTWQYPDQSASFDIYARGLAAVKYNESEQQCPVAAAGVDCNTCTGSACESELRDEYDHTIEQQLLKAEDEEYCKSEPTNNRI